MNPLFAIVLSIALAGSPPPMIAHRGESFDAPENTMAAFRLAWQRDVEAIELDVHLTRDGKLILCHDADTERTTGQKLIIKNSDYRQLRQLEAGSWKDPRWKGEAMPSLDEALATIPERARCFIEIKVGAEAVPAVAASIKASGKRPEQLAIISFQDTAIAEAKRQLPQIKAYYLASFKQDKKTKEWKPTVQELIDQAKGMHADGLDLSFKGPLDAESVKQIKAAGLEFYVWTVDDIEVAQKFADWGADGITTNRAAWLREQLSK
jgi:glycerophosphoryl diester phosphodiesterase